MFRVQSFRPLHQGALFLGQPANLESMIFQMYILVLFFLIFNAYSAAVSTHMPTISMTPTMMTTSNTTYSPSLAPTSAVSMAPVNPPTSKPTFDKTVHLRESNTLSSVGATATIAVLSVLGGIFAGFFILRSFLQPTPEERMLLKEYETNAV